MLVTASEYIGADLEKVKRFIVRAEKIRRLPTKSIVGASGSV